MHFHGRDLRKGRVSMPGQIYHVTIVTKDRFPAFSEFQSARTFIHCMEHIQKQAWVNSMAYVLMPDHLHWLFSLGEKRELSEVIRLLKGYSARTISNLSWQKGFHDRAIRAEEDLLEVTRYIVANPLRAGLVKSVKDYPHWDSIWL